MHKTIRAKMYVQSILAEEYREVVDLSCVYGGTTNAEDNTFSKATPSGSLKLTVDNKACWGFFKPGMKFFVDISAVPEPVAAPAA